MRITVKRFTAKWFNLTALLYQKKKITDIDKGDSFTHESTSFKQIVTELAITSARKIESIFSSKHLLMQNVVFMLNICFWRETI